MVAYFKVDLSGFYGTIAPVNRTKLGRKKYHEKYLFSIYKILYSAATVGILGPSI